MAEVQAVTDENFDAEVLKAFLPVLVDFWAPWCGPCRMVSPIVETLSEEHSGKLKVVKMNTDDNIMTATQYHISGIPSLLLFKDGKVVDQLVGAVPKQHLDKMVSKYI